LRPRLAADDLSRLTAALAGRFAIERELGQGGMATVYLARDLKLPRMVAVKVLRRELAEVLGTERFLREIQTVAGLGHPHILQLHDSGEADGLLYFVMPFVDGESLRGRLDREGPLPVATAVQLASEIADALDYAHRHGVVHRDIKPENILLQTGHAVVSDFGIAKALDDASGEGTARTALTETGMGIGTPLYMSPEQVMGDRVDGRADIYSLGCVLYQMLEGRPPFEGPTRFAVATQHSVAPVPPLKHSRAAISPALEQAVYKSLAKAPEDRFASAEEFRAAITGAAPVPAPPLRWPFSRQATAVLALVAAVVVVLVAVYKPWGPPPKPVDVMPSIAVLALKSDSAGAPFGEGVAEEITTKLGKIPGLRVAPRDQAFSFHGDSVSPREIGRRLNVRYVLGGSVRLDGSERRVSVRLINVADGNEVWAEAYIRDVRDRHVFAVQDSIALAIVGALRIQLSGTAKAALANRSTDNPEAHELYLKGPVALNSAIGFFQQAIALDSNYALAWAGLADAYSLTPVFGDRPPAESFAKAKAAVQRARMLDSTLAEVHTSLGIIALFHDWDWPAARREFDRALVIDSTDVLTHQFRAQYFHIMGQHDSALADIRTALRLDPVNPLLNARLGSLLVHAHRYKEAEAAYHQALALEPTNVSAKAELAFLLALQHQFDSAFAIFRSLDDTTDLNRQGGFLVAGPMAYAFGVAGRRGEALKIQRYLEERARTHYIVPQSLASIALVLGDTARALDELERGYRERSFLLPFLTDEDWVPLRGQPRFQRIIRDMGLTLPPVPVGKPH
jgi:TolB-like protein